MRSVRWPSANRSAIRDGRPQRQHHLPRDQPARCRPAAPAAPAPPVSIVPRTSAIVLSSLASGKIRYSSRLVTRDESGLPMISARTGEALGVHRRVLVADLPGLDEVAQRSRASGHRARRRSRPAGRRRARPARRRTRRPDRRRRPVGLATVNGVAGQLQAAVQRARLFAADDAADGGAGPLDLLGGRADLGVEHAVGDLAGQHEAEHHDHGQRQPERQGDHPQLQRAAPRDGRRLDSTHSARASRGRSGPNDSECVASSPRSSAGHGGPALYPTPRTVSTTCGFSGSFSTLARSRWTCTFTKRVSAGWR